MKQLILALACAQALLAAPAVQAATAPATPTVAIQNFAFDPASLTIDAGQTVRFVNRDSEAHTVTAAGGAFDSKGLDTGDQWTHRFDRPGKYAYFCALHPYMKGTIVVRSGKAGGL